MEVLERHASEPFSWQDSHCFFRMMDAAKAVTGVDPYENERGKAKTKRGAYGRLKRRGFASIEEALAAVYPRIPMAQAKRGDLVVIPADKVEAGAPAGGIVIGADLVGVTETGSLRVPLSPDYTYFSVRG